MNSIVAEVHDIVPYQPIVSIVVPAYNHGSYLARAIDSILAQSYPVELIVIDDGSTDATREVLAGYGERFHWETQQNLGQAATLNRGWGMARGEILGYLSADDFLMPDAVGSAVTVLGENPHAVVAYCDFELVDPDDRPVRYVRAADFSLKNMLTRFSCPPGPGAFFRRSAFESAGGWNTTLRRMPDFEFWLRLALLGRFVRIPQALAAWRVHDGSQSFSAVPPDRAGEPINIISEFFSRPGLPPGIAELRNRSIAFAYLISAQLHARSGRYAEAIAKLVEACTVSPGVLLALETWRIVANSLLQQPAHRFLWRIRRLTMKP